MLRIKNGNRLEGDMADEFDTKKQPACLATESDACATEKNNTEAQKHFIQATDLEKRTSYAYGAPQIPKPSFELYGEWLAMNKPKEALQQFELSLRVAPNKTLSRQGKEKALKLLAEL